MPYTFGCTNLAVPVHFRVFWVLFSEFKGLLGRHRLSVLSTFLSYEDMLVGPLQSPQSVLVRASAPCGSSQSHARKIVAASSGSEKSGRKRRVAQQQERSKKTRKDDKKEISFVPSCCEVKS